MNILKKASFALIDQIVVSFGNFIVTFMLARHLSKEDFGAYVLAYSLLTFAMAIHASLITTPLSVLISALDETKATESLRALHPGQRLLSIFNIAVFLVISAVIWVIPQTRILAPALFILSAIIFFQLGQSYLRFIMFSRFKMKAALVNDIISYGGQVMGIYILIWYEYLNTPNAILVIGVTSLLAWGYGLYQCKRYFGPSSVGILEGLKEYYNYGKWLVGTNIISWVKENIITYVSVFFLGLSAPAILKAIQTLFGPTHFLLLGVESVIPQHATRVYLKNGKTAFDNFMKQFLVLVTLPIVLFISLLSLFSKDILQILYRNQYDEYFPLVWIIGIQYLFISLLTKPIISLKVIGQPKYIFNSNLIALSITSIISVVLIYYGGLYGAAFSKGISSFLMFSIASFTYFRIGRSKRSNTDASNTFIL